MRGIGTVISLMDMGKFLMISLKKLTKHLILLILIC